MTLGEFGVTTKSTDSADLGARLRGDDLAHGDREMGGCQQRVLSIRHRCRTRVVAKPVTVTS